MKKISRLVLCLCFFCLTGCVNYAGILESQTQAIPSGNEGETKNEAKDEKVSTVIGDVDKDGKVESIEYSNGNLIIYSGTRICKKIEIGQEHRYKSITTQMVDFDNDNENEIIAMLWTDERSEYIVSNVKMIDKLANGQYDVIDFPEENKSNYAESGIDANISIKDEFVYNISIGDYSFDVDVSSRYNISVLSEQEYLEIKKKWKKMEQSDYHGGVLGVYDIVVLKESNGTSVIQVKEYVTGGDDEVIGSVVIELLYDASGHYEIINVLFS